ncbi:MAG: RloB domain-containing protein, partial [Flammeovirgaceae bacterium]
MKRVRIKQRHIYQHILVLCEGDTEYIYLNGLKQSLGRDRQHGIKIEIETFKKHDGLSLIKEAVKRVIKARKEGNPYTSIWAVFDHD